MSASTCPNCGQELSSDSLLPEDWSVCPACKSRMDEATVDSPLADAAQELAELPVAGEFQQALAQPHSLSEPDDYRLAPPDSPERPRPASTPARPAASSTPEPEPSFFCLPLLAVVGITLAGMLCLCPLSMFWDPPQGLLILWGIGLIFGGIGWFAFRFKKFTGEHMQDEAPWYLRGGLAVLLQLTGYVIQEPLVFGPPFSVFILGGLLCISPMFIPDLRPYFRKAPVAALPPPHATTALQDSPPAQVGEQNTSSLPAATVPAAALPAAKSPLDWKKRLTSGEAVYLSDLEEFGVQAGPCPMGKNGELGNGSRIVVQGKESPKGVGMHPPNPPMVARACYRVGQQRAVLRGSAALNDTAESPFGAAIFSIHGDGKLLWRSAPLKSRGQASNFQVDLDGVEVLELSVAVEGLSHYVHAVWVEPRLTKE